MKKTIKLLLTSALLLPLAAGMQSQAKAEEKDSVEVVLPACLAKVNSDVDLGENAVIMDYIPWDVDSEGKFTLEMSPGHAADFKETLLMALAEQMTEIIENDDAVESVTASPDFSKIEVFVDPAKFNDEENRGFYVVAEAAAFYQGLRQVPAGDIDVQLEFVNKDTYEVLKKMNLMDIMIRQAELGRPVFQD